MFLKAVKQSKVLQLDSNMKHAIVVNLLTFLALQWLSKTQATHFRHAIITWAPANSYSNTLILRFRMAFRRSFSSSYNCDQSIIKSGALRGSGGSWIARCSSGYCSSRTIANTGFQCTDFSVDEDWTMGENNFTYTFPSVSKEWVVSYQGCCWISSLVKYPDGNWLVSTTVNLTRRSDTGRINSSPVSKSPAIIRFREGCPQSFRIPVEDPDDDVVKCRWATYSESSRQTDSFPHGVIDERACLLHYNGRNRTAGTYAVALTLEDFPEGTTDFSSVTRFSAVGLQFLVIITARSGSCTDVPLFTKSTPSDGECTEVQIGSAYRAVIEVKLQDLSRHVTEIVTSSPVGMQLTPLRHDALQGIFYRNITWYPSQYQVGQQLFCFKAKDSAGSETEWRCITILVGLSNTPRVVLGTQWPRYPRSQFGTGFMWLSIQFDRVIKKPRTSAYIRLVLLPSEHTVYKVDTLSRNVVISANKTALLFALPKAALSMRGSYAILIDRGAVVGLGCSFDGPPTPGISSPKDWGFNVFGICSTGYSLDPPYYRSCVDVNECGNPSRKKRYAWWWPVTSTSSSPTPTFSTVATSFPGVEFSHVSTSTPGVSASASPPFPSAFSQVTTSTPGVYASASPPSLSGLALECFNHSYLEDSVRGQGFYNGYYGYYQCDNYLPFGWYRFRGAAGTQMPTKCVGKNRCSSHAPGWLSASHPSVEDGIVTAKVCFHWTSGCCTWSTNIRVRNCSGFYVYELRPPPTCWLRYCGNGGSNQSTTTSSPQTSPTPVRAIYPTPASKRLQYHSSTVTPQKDPDFHLQLPSDCEQVCHNTPGSYICSCVRGYQLASDGKSCSDINECSVNNGGCSHHCYNIPGAHYCGCPEGTTMAANNLTCVEPGVSVTCGEHNMSLSIEKQAFSFVQVEQVHLRYSSCKATENDTHLTISTLLNDCGTSVNETEDALVFWNELRVDAVIIDGVITRSHDIRLPFYCSYSRKKLVSLSFKPLGIYNGQEAGYGNFTFRMDFFKSGSFVVPYSAADYPLQLRLNDYIYVRYSVESSADLVIMAENCRATKDGSFYSLPQYNIIQNGCGRDTTMVYSYNSNRAYQEFRIKVFRFFNDYNSIYFHCELLACHQSSTNSRCRRGCLPGRRRKKRAPDNSESTTKNILSLGPIEVQDDLKQGDAGQNKKEAALIGGVAGAGGVCILAFAALGFLFVKYRVARRLMNRNKVGDLYATQEEEMDRKNAYIQEDDMNAKEHSL
ncbi:uncharacterized protein LOC114963338 isoform X8 [Acropora millepora]|uniref:uncharacterized protein LOC114963338 isoform X8 n=1 Tax=Acropora millepora TaxID=45264 RepID=UPI001CF1229B|nr:uncharacterized protein LOC114963338 isoform X8 [Acropora millepora]